MKNITIESGLKTILNPAFPHIPRLELGNEGEKSFGETLVESLGKVNNLQLEANKTIEDLATGKNQSIHEAMEALGKADIAFRFTMQVRNKIVEAYQEIARMPV